MIIKTGICSYGMSGKLFHAPFIEAHPGFELTAIVERHNNDSRERYPNSKLYRSVEELCADTTLDLVIVNTPTHLHFQQVKMALEAGKHVLVEKPFTTTVKEAEELANLATKVQRKLTIYQNRRYDGDFRAVKNVLDHHWLGELREAEIRYDRYRPVFGGKQHKEGDLPGAGIIYDLSPHLVDQALQLFGWPDALFADVWKMRDDVQAKDYFEILFYYPKLRVRLKATCICRIPGIGYQVHGMKGSFIQQRSDLQEQALLEGVKPSLATWCPGPQQPDGHIHTEKDGKEWKESFISEPGNYMGLFDDLYRYLCGEGENPVPAAAGIRTVRIIEAALQSAASGQVVKLESR